MAEYTVYRMVAIKVEADSRKEAIDKTTAHIFSREPITFRREYSLGKGTLISAVKTK